MLRWLADTGVVCHPLRTPFWRKREHPLWKRRSSGRVNTTFGEEYEDVVGAAAYVAVARNRDTVPSWGGIAWNLDNEHDLATAVSGINFVRNT